MTAALTPELALAYVRELSADVKAGAVLDPEGAVLAGSPGLAGLPEGGDRALLVERSGAYAMVIECGPFAMPDVIRLDMRAALASLDSAS